jgi:ribose/xylose/arabinose/galactoside ABC-type transport system permease subunit/ABC-type branched-subunit amino acid transport system ATPase component
MSAIGATPATKIAKMYGIARGSKRTFEMAVQAVPTKLERLQQSAFMQPGNAGNRIGLLIIAVLLAAGFSLVFPSFGTIGNANSIALASAALGIAALGTACLLITGNIDLSIGGLYSLVGVIVAKIAVLTGSGLVATAAGMSTGLALGLANGLLVRLLTISPIIVTVATMIIFGGLAYLVTNGDTVGGLPADFIAFGRSRIGPVLTPVVIAILLFLVVAYFLTRTRTGLRLYSIGGNRRAAQLAGIPTSQLVLGAYSFNGLVVAIAAVLTTSRLGIGSPIAGSGFEFGVLTAVILGGVAFNGGSGRPIGIIYGIAAIGILNAGLVFVGLPFFFQDTARGLLLLLALCVDQILQHRRAFSSATEAKLLLENEDFVSSPTANPQKAAALRSTTAPPILSARRLSKRYGAVEALVDADLDVRPGEVVCLLGDNGAGKSTLVKILSGAVSADSGWVTVDGRPVTTYTPGHIRELGVETVYQDLALCENLSVAHNLTLGQEPTRQILGLIPIRDDIGAIEVASSRLAALGAKLPSERALVSSLSGGQRQAVAIARAVHPGIRVIILDEPTASLGVHQTSAVLEVIRSIAAAGTGVVLISHDIRTVRRVADRIVVLRLGRVALDCGAADVSETDLLRLMAGIQVGAEQTQTSSVVAREARC